MEQVMLNLQDVERVIRAFERKYGISSVEFLKSVGNQEVSEDDDFEWEAYLDHRRNLREIHEQLHRDYIERVIREGGPKSVMAEEQNYLAYCA